MKRKYDPYRKPYGNWPEIIGAAIGILLVIAANLAMLALTVFVVVKVLQWTGVI